MRIGPPKVQNKYIIIKRIMRMILNVLVTS